MKQKMSEEKKMILIYSGELLIFAILFGVFGALKIFGIMQYNETRRIVFNWITLIAAIYPITDFLWAVISKRRRQRVCLLDKALVLPLTTFLITFDLISLISKPENERFYIISISCVFFYVAIIYLFQAIYHYFFPLKSLLEDLEKEETKKDENDIKDDEKSAKD